MNIGPEIETPYPTRGTWDQSARQEVTSYKDPSALWTHTFKNIILPQTSFAGGNYLCFECAVRIRPQDVDCLVSTKLGHVSALISFN